MAITVIDGQDDLSSTAQNLHEMQATLTGTTYLAIALTSDSLGGIKALGPQRIIVSDTAAAIDIDTNLTAVALAGAASSVINEGAIRTQTGAAVQFSAEGGSVQNQGSIESVSGTAILFSGAGLNSVINASGTTIKGAKGIEVTSPTGAKLELINGGTIDAAGIAVIGGADADRITNTGTLKTTSAAAGAVVMDLGGGNDFYDGKLGTIIGGMIKLGEGNDIAFGGSGNDTFAGGKGTNIIDGGDGTDTADYSDATATNTTTGISVNLGLTFSQGTNYSQDLLLNIENITGSAFNDTLTGNGLNNILKGGNGDDTLDGGTGSDTIDGGDGNNTLRFSSSTAATVDLTNAAAQDTGYGTDLLIGIGNLEGGSGNDTFTGTDQVNRLVGNGGNDTLKGGAGNDTLQGGSGNDSLQGGADGDTLQGDTGDDTLAGGAGNDMLEGGTGKNTAEFSGNRNQYSIADNGSGTFTITDNQTGRDGTDQLKEIRFAKFADQTIALTNGAPTSFSTSSSFISVSENAAIGSNVTSFFGEDPDGDALTFTLVSNPGGLFAINGTRLVLNGRLDYETATQHSITVKASDGWGGELTKVITVSVRNNTAETTSVIRYGTNAADEFFGEAGNDRLTGLGGADRFYGESGSDTLVGGAGNDILSGGGGADVFVFDAKPNAKSNLDWIIDFSVVDDTIHLSKRAFSKIAKKGTLSKDAFVVGDRFKDAQDRILYHKKAGALFYDPDGTGDAKAIQFATIGKNLKITHKDFYVI